MVKILGKEVGSTGYGLMGLTWRPTPVPDEEAFAAMKAALNAGCTFWNGGEFYGTPEANSLTLLEKYFTKHPEDVDKVFLSIKVGSGASPMPNGKAENVKRAVDDCSRVLTKKKIDLLEMARVDPDTPIETTLKEMEKYVRSGQIGGIGISEVRAETVRRAAKVTKIAAVEIELSLWATEPFTNGIVAACKENDIPIVAYSPLGRGMLTGQIQSIDDLGKDDMRRHLPRFQPGAFETNLDLVKQIQAVAKNKKCTPGQLAIAWVRAQSGKGANPVILPIPGASSASRVEENAKEVHLTESENDEIEKILAKATIVGGRYAADHSKYLEG